MHLMLLLYVSIVSFMHHQGESGQNAMKGPINKEQAIADFEKKFKDKTKNDWVNRKNFKPAAGKYTLIEMDDTEEEEAPVEVFFNNALLSQKRCIGNFLSSYPLL